MATTSSKILSIAGKTALAAGSVLIAKKLFSATPKGTGKAEPARNKVVLITGGSRGLGLALAQELGSLGYRLALCARDTAELEEACRRLAEMNIEAVPITCDVTKQHEISSLLERVLERFGRIDILVNNAGIIKVGPLENFEHADFEHAMDLMFWAPVNLTLAVLPHMKKQGSGEIVNITSIGGRVSVPHLLPYSCAKFALTGFSTGLSVEVKSDHIHVLTVIPGLMRTGSYLNAEFTGEAGREFAWFGLLGNLPGFSVSAEYAAKCIRLALERKRYTCTISLPAKLLVASEALMPEVTRSALQFINSTFLPAGKENQSAKGKQLNPSFGKLFQAVTSLGKAAALRYNE